MDTLREQIIEEMKARRIDHKTYTDADWLMAEYEKHIAEVLCELLEGEKGVLKECGRCNACEIAMHCTTAEATLKANQALTKAQALIRQTLDPISSNER